MKTNFLSILVLLSFIWSACSNKETEKAGETADTLETISLTKEQIETSKIQLGNLTQMCFHDRIVANAKVGLTPNGKITLSYPFSVSIGKIFVCDGEKITPKQPLFTIEGMEILKLQQDYATAYFKYNALKTEYQRQKELVKDKVVSEKDFLQLESEYYTQQVQYQTLSALLEKIGIDTKRVQDGEIYKEITVYSPVNGYLKLNSISKGMAVEPNQVIMELYDLSQLTISMLLFEKEAINVHNGDTVFFYRLNEKDKVYRAVIMQISKVVDNQTHTVMVYAKPIADEGINLFVNSFVQVEIIFHDRLVNALPEDAIIKQDNKNYVYVLKENQGDTLYIFQKRLVNIGGTDKNFTEVLDNIQEKIIVKGASIL